MEGFPLSVDLKSNGAPTFDTPDDVERWITKEEGTWAWAAQTDVAEVHQAFEPRFRQQWRQSREALSRYRSNPEARHAAALKQQLEQSFGESHYLHSDRREATFVNAIASKVEAQAALGYFLGIPFSTRASVPSAGLVRAILFHLGLPTAATAEKEALATLYQQGIVRITELDERKGQWARSAHAAIESLEQQREEAKGRVSQVLDDAGRQTTAMVAQNAQALAAAKAKLEELTRTYENALALAAPVLYWRNRRKQHQNRASAFAGLTLLVAAGGGGLLYHFVSSLFSAGTPPHWQLVMLAFIVTLFLWALRIVVRLFWGNVHLEMDAAERVVMMEAFLSLSKEKHIEKQEDRTLVLSALFRHAATGIVKDDAAPATPLAILSRLLGRS